MFVMQNKYTRKSNFKQNSYLHFFKKYLFAVLYSTAFGILILWPGIEPATPVSLHLEAHGVNHWVPEEVPLLWSFKNKHLNNLLLHSLLSMKSSNQFNL